MFRADAGLIEVCVNNFQGSEKCPGTSSPAATQGSTINEQASTSSEKSCRDGLNKVMYKKSIAILISSNFKFFCVVSFHLG